MRCHAGNAMNTAWAVARNRRPKPIPGRAAGRVVSNVRETTPCSRCSAAPWRSLPASVAIVFCVDVNGVRVGKRHPRPLLTPVTGGLIGPGSG